MSNNMYIMSKTKKSTGIDNEPYLYDFFKNSVCLQIIDFFLSNPKGSFSKKEIVENSTVSLRNLHRYLPMIAKSKYNIIHTFRQSLDAQRHNVNIYSLNLTNPIVNDLLLFRKDLTNKSLYT